MLNLESNPFVSFSGTPLYYHPVPIPISLLRYEGELNLYTHLPLYQVYVRMEE